MFQCRDEPGAWGVHPGQFVDKHNLALFLAFFFQEGDKRIEGFQPVGGNGCLFAPVSDEAGVETAQLFFFQFLSV